MFRLQREAKKIRKELKNIHVEAEAQGVKVVVTGDQKIHSIEIGSDVPKERLSTLLIDTLNRALSKAQLVSADKMQGVMGEMGLGMGNEG